MYAQALALLTFDGTLDGIKLSDVDFFMLRSNSKSNLIIAANLGDVILRNSCYQSPLLEVLPPFAPAPVGFAYKLPLFKASFNSLKS